MFRIGHGFDAHQFCSNRPLILGGVTIPYEKGLLGHSDADVLTHAIMDACLGAVALGSIGDHFPDTDPAYKDCNSLDLLKKVVQLVFEKRYVIKNIDSVVVAQEPKLKSWILPIRESLAGALKITPMDAISVKATTTEKMGYEGRLEGMSSHAVVLLSRLAL